MSILLLQKQHEQINGIIQEIVTLTKDNLEEKSFEIALKIGQLAGVITVHLQSEDKFLYPNLLKHEKSLVRSMAASFTKEMGDLSKKFEVFKTTYKQPQNIKDNPQKFKQDLEKVVALLDRRIKREEVELYPLLGR